MADLLVKSSTGKNKYVFDDRKIRVKIRVSKKIRVKIRVMKIIKKYVLNCVKIRVMSS